jgi:hypothetical protein
VCVCVVWGITILYCRTLLVLCSNLGRITQSSMNWCLHEDLQVTVEPYGSISTWGMMNFIFTNIRIEKDVRVKHHKGNYLSLPPKISSIYLQTNALAIGCWICDLAFCWYCYWILNVEEWVKVCAKQSYHK